MIDTAKVASEILSLPLTAIRRDGGTQPRAAIVDDVVQDYAQEMMEGAHFPPVTVFYDGSDYWLADGFHRYYAARRSCQETIQADVKQGTQRDAVWESLGANKTHGLRRCNDDKNHAVQTALLTFPEKSNREIAQHCGVSHDLVNRVRTTMSTSGRIVQIESPHRLIERNGTTYAMNTSNIGRSQIQAREREIGDGEVKSAPREVTYVPDEYPSSFADTPLIDDGAPDMPTNDDDEEEQNEGASEQNVGRTEAEQEDASLLAGTAVRPCDAHTTHVMRVMGSSESPEWYTPSAVIAYVLKLFGEIDLDPCSNSREAPTVPATTVYTKDDDGLAHQWRGKVYMNPPYGSEIGKWIGKLVESYEHGEVEESLALLPGRIDTVWFQPLYAYFMCNIRGRLQFANAASSAPFPCVIVYMGKRVDAFIEVFQELGPIMRRVA